jgi:hypothetical protein
MTTHDLRQIQASCTGPVDIALDVNIGSTEVSNNSIRPAARAGINLDRHPSF